MTANTDPKSVLITGASSGIGESCALELHRLGYRVFAGVRREADGDRLVSQTSSDGMIPIMMDVTDLESVKRAAAIIERSTSNGIAGLVNNAGIAIPCPLEFLPIDQFRLQLEVNVVGVLSVTQVTMPFLRLGKGRIVNMSSITGFVAPPYTGAYAASKHALEAISDAIRVEVRKSGVRVAVIEPGDVATPMWQTSRDTADRIRDQLADKIPDREIPEEVKQLYAADIAAMRKSMEIAERRAMPVSRVTRAVVHALCAKRPKTRYILGLKANAAARGLRVLPDRLRDWIVRVNLGMK